MAGLSEDPGKVLLPIARATISSALGRPVDAVAENSTWLHQQGASFITLTQHQKLRGCVGTLRAHRSLLLDVKANAHAAAFRDHRFSPLTAAELDSTDIEISLLSATQPLRFSGEQEALAQLQPGVDGVVFEFGRCHGAFLPQVWEQLPDASLFMAHLKRKAGLHPDFWHDQVKLSRFTVSKWNELDFRQGPKQGLNQAADGRFQA